jgi:hypothetical protein
MSAWERKVNLSERHSTTTTRHSSIVNWAIFKMLSTNYAGSNRNDRRGPRKVVILRMVFRQRCKKRLTGPTDDLEPTGRKSGGKGESKKGDFVITTNDGARIAIEAKNRESDMSKSDIGEYLEKTLQNREVAYVMMVMRNAGAVPATKTA